MSDADWIWHGANLIWLHEGQERGRVFLWGKRTWAWLIVDQAGLDQGTIQGGFARSMQDAMAACKHKEESQCSHCLPL